MKKIYIIIAILLTYASVQARSCRDEPERCPVVRLSCIEQNVDHNKDTYTYITASLYDSLYSGTSVRVGENLCVRTHILTCTQNELKGSWEIYKSKEEYNLLRLNDRRIYPLECKVNNENNL